jgi:hypothetical protein
MIIGQMWQKVYCIVQIDSNLVNNFIVLTHDVLLNFSKCHVEARLSLVWVEFDGLVQPLLGVVRKLLNGLDDH